MVSSRFLQPLFGGDGPTVFAHACKMGLEGVEAQGLALSLRPLSGLAQNEEPGGVGGVAGGRGRMGQKEMAITPDGKNRIMIFGPKTDGTYVVEFRTAEGESLAISIPRTETAVIRHFQERMPYGLFVPDGNAI
jgi:hypothetical protein